MKINWQHIQNHKWWWLAGAAAIALIVFGTWWYRKSKDQVEITGSSELAQTIAQSKSTSDANTSLGEQADVPPETSTDTAEKKDQTPAPIEDKTQPSATENTTGDTPKNFSIKNHLVSFGYEKASSRTIDMIVLHSSYNSGSGDPYDINKVFDIWKSYGVAPHYAIARDGTVYRLVDDQNIAYHAGVSEWKGRKNLNDVSIGVEIINTKDGQYTKAQYQAVRDLIAYLKSKYDIKYVVGHDDIAPGRKDDPWNFDWNKLK